MTPEKTYNFSNVCSPCAYCSAQAAQAQNTYNYTEICTDSNNVICVLRLCGTALAADLRAAGP